MNSKKSWAELKYKIKEITRKTTPLSFSERIVKLNYLMRGWLNYFTNATGFSKLKYLDSWVRARLRYCIWKGWKNPKRRRRAYIQLGVPKFLARQYSYSRLSGWRLAQSPIMMMTEWSFIYKMKPNAYEMHSMKEPRDIYPVAIGIGTSRGWSPMKDLQLKATFHSLTTSTKSNKMPNQRNNFLFF